MISGESWKADRCAPFPSQAGITLRRPDNDTENTFTETELFEALSDIYSFCFLDIEGGQVLKTKNRVEVEIQRLMDHIEANVGGSIVKRVRPILCRLYHRLLTVRG